MATRSIVTSQPDVECAVCGRRLLRGEQPDVFLVSGSRRDVCELCAPRAADEGWLREGEGHAMSLRPARQRRARNLFDRLLQRREPTGEAPAASLSALEPEETTVGAYDFLEEDLHASGPELTPPLAAHEETASHPLDGLTDPRPSLEHGISAGGTTTGNDAPKSGDVKAQRALEVFNAGAHPRRIAGIARSLDTPDVSVRPLAEAGSRVSIVIAWELCWYRYEVDLGDEAAGAEVVAQGTELGELQGEDLRANAAAAQDGTLALVASSLR